jgi:hypothetical protein
MRGYLIMAQGKDPDGPAGQTICRTAINETPTNKESLIRFRQEILSIRCYRMDLLPNAGILLLLANYVGKGMTETSKEN